MPPSLKAATQPVLELMRPSAAVLLWPASVLVYVVTAATHAGQPGFAASLPVLAITAWMALRCARCPGPADGWAVALVATWSCWALLTQLPGRTAPTHGWAPALAIPILGAGVLVAHLAQDRDRLQRDLATGAALAVLFAAACCPLLMVIGRPFATAAVFGFDNLNLVTLLTTPLIAIGIATPPSGTGDRGRRILLWAALAYLVVIGVATGRRGQALFLAFAAAVALTQTLAPLRSPRWWRIILPLAALAVLVGLGLVLIAPAEAQPLDQIRQVAGKRIDIYRFALPAEAMEWVVGRGSSPTLQLGAAPLDERDWRYLNEATGPLVHAHNTFLQQLLASGSPALLALLGLVGLAFWRAAWGAPPATATARLLAVGGAGIALLVEDLTLRPDGALVIGLLLGLALGSGTSRRSDSLLIARLQLGGASVAAMLLILLSWSPTWIRDGTAAEHLQALEAARDPSHAQWHLLRLMERVDSAAVRRVRAAVEARLGPILALRWAAAAPHARRDGDAASWARLHPLDVSSAAFLPQGPASDRIIAGRALAAIRSGKLEAEEASTMLGQVVARFPQDPSLIWSLLRIRAHHPALVDAVDVRWERLATWPTSWNGADPELATGLRGLPPDTRAHLRQRLERWADRHPPAAEWAQQLFSGVER